MQTQFPAPPRALRTVTHPANKTIPSVDLYQVTPGPRHRLRIISSAVYSVYVHQSARRPLPCYGETDMECEHHRLPIQRQHYLYVTELERTRLRLLRLTNGLVYEVLPELVQEGRNLNGKVIEVWRSHKDRADSPMMGTFVDNEELDQVILSTPPIEWAVNRMLSAPPRLQPWRPRASSATPAPTVATQPTVQEPYPGFKKDQLDYGRAFVAGRTTEAEQLKAVMDAKLAAFKEIAGN